MNYEKLLLFAALSEKNEHNLVRRVLALSLSSIYITFIHLDFASFYSRTSNLNFLFLRKRQQAPLITISIKGKQHHK